MKTKRIGRIVLTVGILALSAITLKRNSYQALINLAGSAADAYVSGAKEVKNKFEDRQKAKPNTAELVSSQFTDDFWQTNKFLDVTGYLQKYLNIRGMYADSHIYVTDDKRLMSMSEETSTDYEFHQLQAIREKLDEAGINLLYVQLPTKYGDDQLMIDAFGVDSYTNRNADKLLTRLREVDYPVMDLREKITEQGKKYEDMFFRTDHHWDVPTALWAAGQINEELNERFGYEIDMQLFDEDAFDYQVYKDKWLGESGRKVGVTYVGLDDYTVVRPKYETRMKLVHTAPMLAKAEDKAWTGPDPQTDLIQNCEVWDEGDFGILIAEPYLALGGDCYDGPSLHYTYMYKGTHKNTIVNEMEDEHKVLLVGDSFLQSLMPFMSLGVHELTGILNRGGISRIAEYAQQMGCDTVVIAPSVIMIGEHDNPASSNYTMFSFVAGVT